MADNNPDEKIDAFLNSLDRLREKTEDHLLAQEGYERRADGTIKGIETQLQRRRELELKVYKEIEEKLGKERAVANKRTEMFTEQLAGMNRYIDSNNKIIKTSVELSFSQRQQIASIKRADEATSKLNQAQDNLVANLKTGLGDITKGMGNFALSVGNGSTSFTTLNPLIDIVANSMGALAKAIPFVGEAAAAGIKAGAEASKFVLELMDKNIKAFQDIANSGGLVADGMEGVTRQFLDSGMSLEGFKKAIKDNAGELAQWGQTVGKGADKFTKAVGMLTKDDSPLAEAGMNLRKLGMTADDIGTASAGFLQQELRLGRARNMTEEQLAKGTAKYAQELDALQKVTGLSKEDLIKQRNEMLTDSRFSASMDVLRETNETGAEAIMQFASTIKDPDLKRGFMDLTSGAGNTDAAKKAMRVLGDTVPDIIEKLKNSKPEEFAKNFDSAQTMLKKGAKQAVDTFGKETFALMPDTKVLGSYSSLRDIQNQQNISLEEAIEVQNKQKALNKGLTKDAVEAQQNMERMGQEVFRMGNTLMPSAAVAVNKFTSSLVDFVKYVYKLLGKGEAPEATPAGNAGGVGKNEKWSDAEITAAKEALNDPNLGAKDKAYLNDMLKRQAGSASPATPTPATPTPAAAAPAAAAPYNAARDSQTASVPPTPVAAAPVAAPSTATSSGTRGLASKAGAPATSRTTQPAPNEHTARSGGVENIKLASIASKSGKSAQVGAEYAPQFQKLIDYLDSTGYEIRSLGGYINRDVRNKPGQKSVHAHGGAIDINPDTNPMGSTLITDMPNDIASVAQGFGLGWGGNWKSSKDAMHFSAAMSEGGNLLKAMDGGIFDGPTSGYDVELHGREAIVPLNNNATKEPLSSMSMPGVDQLASITQSMMQMMEDKFDEMIDQLSTGNNISDKLLRNSMV